MFDPFKYLKDLLSGNKPQRPQPQPQKPAQNTQSLPGLNQFKQPTVNTPLNGGVRVAQPQVKTPTQAPQMLTPQAQKQWTQQKQDQQILAKGTMKQGQQVIQRQMDDTKRVKLDPLFKQGKSFEDMAKTAGYSNDEVRKFAERNYKGYGDQGLLGNVARETGKFVGTMADNAAGIVRKPIVTINTALNRDKLKNDLATINQDLSGGRISPAAAQERANLLTKDLIGEKAYQDPQTGMYRIGTQNVAEFGGAFAQQGLDTGSVLPFAGGAASGASKIAQAVGRPGVQAGLEKAASILTAGAQTQATSKLAQSLAAKGMNPQAANLLGNAITSNAKQSAVWGTAQTGTDVASGRGITPESLAMNYGADFVMGTVPEIGLGSLGHAINPHTTLVKTNPNYSALNDQLRTAVDPTQRAAVKQQMAAIIRRQGEAGFIGGPKATGFADAQAQGRVFTDTPDGLPRFEVDDSGAKLNLQGIQKSNKLGDILDHPELFNQYPELKNVKVELSANPNSMFDGKKITLSAFAAKDPSVLLHEVQHAIQSKEGFAFGTSAKSVNDPNYRNSAGEAEARAVQARRNMTDGERYVKPEMKEPLYHGTSEGAARNIQRDGLMGNMANPFAPTKGDASKIFFSKSEATGQSFADRKGMGGSYLLRVNKSDDILPDMKRVGRGEKQDFIAENPIDPERIEIKTPTGEWTPIKNYDFNEKKLLSPNKLQNTFDDSLDVPKKDLIMKKDTDTANFTERGRTPKTIHPEDQNVMTDFIDYQNGVYRPSPKAAHELEIDAARIAERYGLEMPNTAKKLAGVFDKRLQQDQYAGVAYSMDAPKNGPVAPKVEAPQPIKTLLDTARSKPVQSNTVDELIARIKDGEQFNKATLDRLKAMNVQEAMNQPTPFQQDLNKVGLGARKTSDASVRSRASRAAFATSSQTAQGKTALTPNTQKRTSTTQGLESSSLPNNTPPKVKVTTKSAERQVPVMKQVADGDTVTATNVNPNKKVAEKRYSVDEDGKMIADKKGAYRLFTDDEGKVSGVRIGKEYFDKSELGDLSSVNGYGSSFATARRNVERAFDKPTADKLGRFLVDYQQEKATGLITRRVEYKKQLDTMAKDLGISFAGGTRKAKKVSAAIQDFGESVRNKQSLVDEFGADTATKIVKADKWFRKQYDSLLDEMNTTLTTYGYDPVPKRKDYYTHFSEPTLWQKFGLKMQEIQNLASPTMQDADPSAVRGKISNKLAGMSEQTKPNKRFNPFALERKGEAHTADAFQSFERYLDPTLNNIYMTPAITRARVVAQAIANDADLAGKNANATMIQLREWANNLAGKSNRFGDRQMADTMVGSQVLKGLGWAQRQAGANTIVGNLSVAVRQPILLAQTTGVAGYKNTVIGLVQEASQSLKKQQNKSGFLTRRYADVTATTAGKLDKARNVANTPLQFIEEHAVRSTWNAYYNDAVAKNMNGAQAIRYADNLTEKTVAGRSIGERPEVFRSKSLGTVTMYQLESGNYWQQFKEMDTKQKLRMVATAYAMNLVFQKAVGSEIGFNPIDAVLDAYGEVTNEENDGVEKVTKAGQRLAGEVLDNTPMLPLFLQTFMGQEKYTDLVGKDSMGGRFGVASPVSTLFDNPWYAVSPFGGGQAKKTIDGIQTMRRGEAQTAAGKTTTEVDNNNPAKWAQAIAFGKNSLQELQDYYASGKKPTEKTGNEGLDTLVEQNKKRSEDFKTSMSAEDYKLYNLSKKDREKLVANGTYSQAKVDEIVKFGDSKKKELGYDTKEPTKELPKNLNASAKTVIEKYDSLDAEARKTWNTEKNTDTEVTKTMQSWIGDKVKVPEVTNEVAKKWADYQSDYVDGKISKLNMNDKKKGILKDAFNSQLSTDEKEIASLSKAELQYYYENKVIDDKNIGNAIAVEKQLFDAGLISKEQLQRNLGLSARGYKTSSSKSTGGTKTKTTKASSGTSKTSIASILAANKSINDTNNDTYLALSKLLGSTSRKSTASKNKIGREVTLKKISVNKGA